MARAKVDALLNTYMPACDLAVLLVNDTKHWWFGWGRQDSHRRDQFVAR
jgi:hypothetical protein